MKKKCLLLAMTVIVMQAVMLFAPISVGAVSAGRSYNLYKTDANITVDGIADAAWEDVPYSDAFVTGVEVIPEGSQNFEAKLQAVWQPVETDDTKIQIYFLVTVKDPTPYVRTANGSIASKGGDSFGLNAYYGDEMCWTGLSDVVAGVETSDWFGNNSGVSTRIQTAIKDDRTLGGAVDTYTIEIGGQFPKTDKLIFDFMVFDNYLGTNGQQLTYSWNGSTNSALAEGVGNIMHTRPNVDETDDVLFQYNGQTVVSMDKASNGTVTLPDYELFGTLIGWEDSDGKLYPVGGTYSVTDSTQVVLKAVTLAMSDYELLRGASALIEEPTALRFEVQENAAAVAALGTVVKEKGAVLVKTADLTDAVLADGTFSAEELTAAGISFDKVVFTTAEGNLYYAVKEGITDLNTAYSAVAYMTVEYEDHSTRTITSEYSAEWNSRSVKVISEAAYADRETVRAEQDGVNYKFKVSKDYAVGEIKFFSYSPYTEEQLDLLDKFRK